jgi:hypothetical protein
MDERTSLSAAMVTSAVDGITGMRRGYLDGLLNALRLLC